MNVQKIRKLATVCRAKEMSSGMANMIIMTMGIDTAMANAACAMRKRTCDAVKLGEAQLHRQRPRRHAEHRHGD